MQVDPVAFGLWSALAAAIIAATTFAYGRRARDDRGLANDQA